MFDRKRPLAIREPRLGYAYTLVQRIRESVDSYHEHSQDPLARSFYCGYWYACKDILAMLEGISPVDILGSSGDILARGYERYLAWLKLRGE